MKVCAICRRAPRGWGWFERNYKVGDNRRDKSSLQFCSMRHLDLWVAYHKAEKTLRDMTKHENAALDHASVKAGEYITGRGKTDLASFTNTEWMALLEIVVTEWTAKLNELVTADCPF